MLLLLLFFFFLLLFLSLSCLDKHLLVLERFRGVIKKKVSFICWFYCLFRHHVWTMHWWMNFDMSNPCSIRYYLRKRFCCSKFDSKHFCYWKFDQNVASLAVARGVLLQLFTIATKVVKEIDQIIASLYMQYCYNQTISIECLQMIFSLYSLKRSIVSDYQSRFVQF